MRYDLGRSKRRIQCQPKVRTCALKIGRDGESTAHNGFPAQHPRRPGEAEPRLEVPAAVLALVECPAVAILASKLNGAAEKPIVGLLIILFDPGGVSLVTHTHV